MLLKKSRKMARTEQNIVKFSYDLVVPLRPFPGNDNYWEVIGKGSEKMERFRCRISFNTIKLARHTINRQPSMKTSPCYKSSLLRDQGFNIYLMGTQHEPLRGVKARGVIHTLQSLSGEQRPKGVIAISTGSFGYILGYYGNIYNIPVTVVMPKTAADDRVQKCRNIGSQVTVVVHGNDILEAHSYALHLAQQRGLFYLDGNDHPNMIIGQATLGIEIVKEMGNVDAVILPTAIDDCGLTAGIAMAIKGANPKIEIFEVKPTDCDTLVKKIRSQTMSMHELTFPVVKYNWHYSNKLSKRIFFDNHVKTNKEAIFTAAKILYETESFSDYYAAIGLAPIADGVLNTLKKKRVVIPVFGEMDSTMGLSTLRSDLSVPRTGSSTSRE